MILRLRRYVVVAFVKLGILFCLLSSLAVHANSLLAVDIIQTSSGRFVAVADRGLVLLGEKAPFRQVKTSSPLLLTAITEKPNGELWAVGHGAKILMSSDSGARWQEVFSGEDESIPLFDISFVSNQVGFAVGAYGAFYRTQDGGNTWLAEYHPGLLNELDQEYLAEIRAESEADYQAELKSILPHLNQITKVGDTLVVVGELGLVAISTDLGKHWQRVALELSGSFYAVSGNHPQGLFITGMRGQFVHLKLDEQILTDTPNVKIMQVDEPVNLNAAIFLSDKLLVLAGNSATLWAYNLNTQKISLFNQAAAQNQVAMVKVAQQPCLRLANENGIREVICAQ